MTNIKKCLNKIALIMCFDKSVKIINFIKFTKIKLFQKLIIKIIKNYENYINL